MAFGVLEGAEWGFADGKGDTLKHFSFPATTDKFTTVKLWLKCFDGDIDLTYVYC